MKSIIALAALVAAANAAPCTPAELQSHGIGSQQTAAYSRWEAVASDADQVAVYDSADAAEPLCTFSRGAYGVPELRRKSIPPQVFAKRAPECFGRPCTNAQACIDQGCSRGCSTWSTPSGPRGSLELNTACIADLS